MKFLTTIILALSSVTVFAKREALCSAVGPAGNGFYQVTTNTACSDYVEVSPGSFKAPKGCAEVFTTHTLKPVSENVRRELQRASVIDSAVCVIGKFSQASGGKLFLAEKVVSGPEDLN